jgi:hypothetical protein
MLSDRHFEAVPAWFMQAVLEPVLADLQRPQPVDFELKPVDFELKFKPVGNGGWVHFQERGSTGSAALGISRRSTPRASTLVSWADWLQEQVFPETQGAWGEARPECPGHPHPASPVELDDDAWWVCPGDRHRVGKIGELT